MIKRLIITAVSLAVLVGCGSGEKEMTKQDAMKNQKKSFDGNQLSTAAGPNAKKAVDRAEKKTMEKAEKPSRSQNPQYSKLITKGENIRPFKARTSDGKNISTNDFEGKYVLLDFWASWCGPCRKEIPHVAKLTNMYKDNNKFQVVGVSLDRNSKAMTDYMTKNSMNWVNIYNADNDNIAAKYGVSRIPFTVLIDPKGKIIATGLRGQSMINEIKGRIKP